MKNYKIKNIINKLILIVCLFCLIPYQVNAQFEFVNPKAGALYKYFIYGFGYNSYTDDLPISFGDEVTYNNSAGSIEFPSYSGTIVNGNLGGLSGSSGFTCIPMTNVTPSRYTCRFGDGNTTAGTINVNNSNFSLKPSYPAKINLNGLRGKFVRKEKNHYLLRFMQLGSNFNKVTSYKDGAYMTGSGGRGSKLYMAFYSNLPLYLEQNNLEIFTYNNVATPDIKVLTLSSGYGFYQYLVELTSNVNDTYWFSFDFKTRTSSLQLFPLYSGDGNDLTTDDRIELGIDSLKSIEEEVNSEISKVNEKTKVIDSSISKISGDTSSSIKEAIKMDSVTSFLALPQLIGAFQIISSGFVTAVQGTPIEMLLSYSLTLGLVLLMIGKMR